MGGSPSKSRERPTDLEMLPGCVPAQVAHEDAAARSRLALRLHGCNGLWRHARRRLLPVLTKPDGPALKVHVREGGDGVHRIFRGSKRHQSATL